MNLKECYEAMNGDYEDAMARLMREASVAKFLRKFIDSQDYSKMEEAITAKDYKAVFMHSHTLKGVCANLSISALQHSSSDICEAVRNGEPTEDLNALLEIAKKDYDLAISCIKALDDDI